MAKRIVTKIGNVFVVKSEHFQKYFQYVANDMTQLNSSVIRVFKKEYPLDSTPNLNEVVAGEIDFYTHVVLRWGIEDGLWEKVGKAPVIGEIDVVFRCSLDYGDPEVKISHRWYVWRINEPTKYVGTLKGKYREAEVGMVINPEGVARRILTGSDGGFVKGF